MRELNAGWNGPPPAGRIADFLRGNDEQYSDRMPLALRDAEGVQEIRAALSTQQGDTGGYLVLPQSAPDAIELALQDFPVRRLAEVIRTEDAFDRGESTTNDTGNQGVLLAENQSRSFADVVFGLDTLHAYKIDSQKVVFPYELLQDSKLFGEAFLGKVLGQRVARRRTSFSRWGRASPSREASCPRRPWPLRPRARRQSARMKSWRSPTPSIPFTSRTRRAAS